MKRIRKSMITAALLMALGVPGTALASNDGGAEIPYWRSEQEARLAVLDDQILDVQRRLFQARMQQKDDVVQRLAPRFEDMRRERMQLMKATGRIDD